MVGRQTITDQNIYSMYRDPDIVEPKPVIKTDPSAPARSAIRRQQRTVRYNTHLRDNPPSSRSRSFGRSRDTVRRSLLEAIRRGDSAVSSTRSRAENDLEIEVEADLAHAEASQRRRLENGRALLRDALSYERPGRRLRTRTTYNVSPPLPALPENRHHTSESDPMNHRVLNLDPLVRQEGQLDMSDYMPTPPETRGDTLSWTSRPRSTLSHSAASVTPRFAPAHRFDDVGEAAFQEYVAEQRIAMSWNSEIDEFPPLRRVRRHASPALQPSGRDSPQDAVDGLGDRRRSFSPENDSWETLLTTMTPDERLPSAHSSFTSATASATSLSSNSASSYGTLITAPSSSTETLDAYPTICDNSDTEESGSEAEHPPHGQDPHLEGPHAQESIGHFSRRIVSRERLLHRHRAEQVSRHRRILEREEELEQIQANLDRLERQVPEEWWAAAGRERNLRNRTGRGRL